ncbi:MAG TPA: flagellar hook-basal body protein [Solirubrobacteraceae bacterium]|nr:flagellar hook-basal body protein [Solirubrobacteraceae bacterium]
MLEGLFSAAAGMNAQQQQLNAIANNLANASTTGYRAVQVGFTDLLYSEVKEAGTATTTGAGAAARPLGYSSAPGGLRQTGDPLDLAISGEGYFRVRSATGAVLLTRNGSFGLDARRRIVTQSGQLLDPPITIPPEISPSEVSISAGGVVQARGRTLGRIAIYGVAAPEKLLATGEGSFAVTPESGPARALRSSTVIQGALEGSDVEVASELAQMALTERGYQMSANAVKIEGQMLATANQIYTSA